MRPDEAPPRPAGGPEQRAASPAAARRSVLAGERPPYRWAWLVSLLLHASLLGAFVGIAMVESCQAAKAAEQKPMVAKLVRLGTPRDPRHLPRLPTAPPAPPATKEAPVVQPGKELNQPPPPTPQPPPPPAPQAAPKPAPAPAPTPAPAAPPQQASAPKARETDSKQRLDDMLKRFAADARPGRAEELPGQLDGDPEGDAEDAAEGDRYLALVEKRLKDRFVVPTTIPDEERIRLSTQIRLKIDRSGTISDIRIERPSGNRHFDAAVESAARRASPLPPPPEHLLRAFPNGIAINYRP